MGRPNPIDMTTQSNLRGIGCMVLATAAFVTTDSLMKVAMAEIPPLQVLILRGLFATCWCVPTLFAMGLASQIPRAKNGWVLLRALSEALAVMCFVIALAKVPIGDITAIMQTSPLLVVVVAALLLRERIGLLRAALIGVGFIGAVMVAQPGSAATSVLAAVGFPAAILAAGRDLLARKVPGNIPAMITVLATLVVVMLCATVGSALLEHWVTPTSQHLLLIAISGLFLMFGQLFLFLAFRLAPASVVAPFLYVATLWAVLSGVLVFRDYPNAMSLAGMALVVGGGLAMVLLDQRRRRKIVPLVVA